MLTPLARCVETTHFVRVPGSVWIAIGGFAVTLITQTIVIAWWASGITHMVHQHEVVIREYLRAAADPTASAAGRALAVEIAHLAVQISELQKKVDR